jgi:hypothetical protein
VAVITLPDVAELVFAFPANEKPAGTDVSATPLRVVSVAVIVSPLAIAALGVKTVAAAVAPKRATVVPETATVLAAALAGTTDTRPKPSADTATSAMRLRSVFVDICFLSISQNQEFPDLGLGD